MARITYAEFHQTRRLRVLYALALLTIAVWLGYAAVASASEPASNGARCIYIVESDGTLVAVCGKAGGK
jgi:hypothetical protein